MSRELKLIYGHLKYNAHGLKFVSRRSIVDSDIFVIECTDHNGKHRPHLATLRPVEYFNIKALSAARMSRIAEIKNAKY